MSLGFNSNVTVGDLVYHVQTEDRGLNRCLIDTVVLFHGRVLHRRSASYRDLLAHGAADPHLLEARVQRQHRDVLEALQVGRLPLEALPEETGIEVKLHNSASWLIGGHAALDVEVRSRNDGPPVAQAEVEVSMEGAQAGQPAVWMGKTDAEGRVSLRFPLPALADPATAALVIRARTPQAQDQLRFQLKARPRDADPISR